MEERAPLVFATQDVSHNKMVEIPAKKIIENIINSSEFQEIILNEDTGEDFRRIRKIITHPNTDFETSWRMVKPILTRVIPDVYQVDYDGIVKPLIQTSRTLSLRSRSVFWDNLEYKTVMENEILPRREKIWSGTNFVERSFYKQLTEEVFDVYIFPQSRKSGSK